VAGGRFDVATGTHTTDFVLAAWTLGIPQMTFLDDEGLRAASAFGMRFADEVAVPDVIATSVLTAFRPAPRRFVRYPGFREEYYLHDLRPDPAALDRLGVEPRHVVGIVRPAVPPADSVGAEAAQGELALMRILEGVAGRRHMTLLLLARDRAQRRRFLALGLPGLIAPEEAVDGVSLIAAADFVVGDGSVMLREAAALGTPAYTVTRRSLTAVDRSLLRGGRLTVAAHPEDLVVRKKEMLTAMLESRDPQVFVEELLTLARRRPRRSRAGGLADVGGAIP
jgi:predicted glycosyltransferase